LHCIVSNVPYKVGKYSGPPELLRSEISFSRTCNIRKQCKLHRKQGVIRMECNANCTEAMQTAPKTRSYLNGSLMWLYKHCWMECVFCSYF